MTIELVCSKGHVYNCPEPQYVEEVIAAIAPCQMEFCTGRIVWYRAKKASGLVYKGLDKSS